MFYLSLSCCVPNAQSLVSMWVCEETITNTSYVYVEQSTRYGGDRIIFNGMDYLFVDLIMEFYSLIYEIEGKYSPTNVLKVGPTSEFEALRVPRVPDALCSRTQCTGKYFPAYKVLNRFVN